MHAGGIRRIAVFSGIRLFRRRFRQSATVFQQKPVQVSTCIVENKVHQVPRFNPGASLLPTKPQVVAQEVAVADTANMC